MNKRLPLLPPRTDDADSTPGRFPAWLHRPLPKGEALWNTREAVTKNRLYTVCEEAKCPNMLECWSHKTATFLAMGKTCTRACGFCEIAHSKAPPKLEADEPMRIAESVQALGLNHVVITMVARDDLPDGGSAHLKLIVEAVRRVNPHITIELLTSDFQGNKEALSSLLEAQPEIFNHNIETTELLTPKVRHVATYRRSLDMLQFAKNSAHARFIKSGLMVGLGESEADVIQTLKDLKAHGCDIVTIGQYLQASRHKLRVKEFVTPEQFERYKTMGLELGLSYVYSGPFVRSSYNAGLVFEQAGATKVITSS